ncbi:MAG: 4Fe-4S binding protein [Spirochaetaceae bacterium]|nr:4Fe-4S binding protein [Spirochaetaceae bacterium]
MILLVLIIIFMLILAATAAYSWFFFSKKMPPKVSSEASAELLAGENCGLCGYHSCAAYLEALLLNKEKNARRCRLQESFEQENFIAKLKEIYNYNYIAANKVAYVFCGGNKQHSKYRFNYTGVASCAAAHLNVLNSKQCLYGCIGLGDCAASCPQQAITVSKGLAYVHKDLCKSCGSCVVLCPTKVIKFVDKAADFVVACSSHDNAEVTAAACSVGCMACGTCLKRAPLGGFSIKDNLCSIDYRTGQEDRWRAAVKCESRAIVPLAKDEHKRFLRKLRQEKG